MTAPSPVVFLLDVDNTLLDNDQVIADLQAHLLREFGAARSARYWEIFEQLRDELGYADYLGALQRYRLDDTNDTQLLQMSFFLLDYPFAKRLYAGALDVLRRLRTAGPTVILSDGDVVFQPHKIRILSAMKAQWKERLTTVFVRQGHYALDPAIIREYTPADVSIERIDDLLPYDLATLTGASPAR